MFVETITGFTGVILVSGAVAVLWLVATQSRRASLAFAVPLILGGVTDALLLQTAGIHLTQIPPEVAGWTEFRHILRMREYQIFVGAVLGLTAVLSTAWYAITRKAPTMRARRAFAGIAFVVGFVALTRFIAPSTPTSVTPALSTAPPAPPQLTRAEIDLVESLGLPTSRAPSPTRLDRLPPVIVLVTVESLARNFVHRANQPHPDFTVPPNATPTLDRLAETAVSFEAHGTTMMPTLQGLYATLLSRPFIYPRTSEGRDFRPLAEILAEAGYETTYFQGAPLTFSQMNTRAPNWFRYMRPTGFAEIAAMGLDPRKTWGWGQHDENVFDAAWKSIATTAPARPIFAHILTLNTHPPFASGLDPDIGPESDPHLTDPLMRALWSTDRQTGKLIARLESSGLMEAGALVIVTADHSPSHWYRKYMPENPAMHNDLIPLYFLHRDLLPSTFREETRRMSSQIDVAPTILSLLDLPVPASYTGRNLFDPATKPLWVSATRLAMSDSYQIELKTPSRTVAVQSGSRADKTLSTPATAAAAGNDDAARTALLKWLRLKQQASVSESRHANFKAPPLTMTRERKEDGSRQYATGPRGEELLGELPGGIRALNPAGQTFPPVFGRHFDGAPIEFDGKTHTGVSMFTRLSVVLELPRGRKSLSGSCAVRFKGDPSETAGLRLEFQIVHESSTSRRLLARVPVTINAKSGKRFTVRLPPPGPTPPRVRIYFTTSDAHRRIPNYLHGVVFDLD